MPQTVSDKDVEQTRARVDALREEVAAEKAKASVTAAAGANAVTIAALQRDETDLKAELAKLRAANAPEAATPPPSPAPAPVVADTEEK